MNQSVFADIRLSLGLLKMIVKEETSLQNCNPYEILV